RTEGRGWQSPAGLAKYPAILPRGRWRSCVSSRHEVRWGLSSFGTDTSAASKGRDRQAKISGEETTWVIPVRSNVGCSHDGRTGCHHWRGPCRLSACDVAAPARLFRTHQAVER